MGRWRPPAPISSPYITPAGFEALQKELDDIWLRRRDVVKALAAAAAEGDRSENAEYIYRKKELGGLDRRIRYLQKRLPALNIVRERRPRAIEYFSARPSKYLTTPASPAPTELWAPTRPMQNYPPLAWTHRLLKHCSPRASMMMSSSPLTVFPAP